ncbi:type II toxin-antitoxin system HicA family toxin [Desulfosporosinus sp. HMP52]|uniref:type II toxin-antitoxin system HicA family toxin n=1 Tax=Desulfosporosinus sp. HMP52 TaxID=1487923 RepID=UPI0006918152|nr:type II toxin-antitoxin system HicA family toxin [Desulfosporosinus sp. HMP52]
MDEKFLGGAAFLNARRILERILFGSKNVRFDDLIKLAEAYGFRLERTNGSHHIFIHTGVRELLNLQDVNGMAKPYQIRQLLKLVEMYSLKIGE